MSKWSWRSRFAPAVVLGVVLLPFVVVFAVALATRSPDEDHPADAIRATAAIVDEHADDMRAVGEAVAARATSASASGGEQWVAYARHLESDAAALSALAQRLRDCAAIVDHDPTRTSTTAPALLRGGWEHLRVDGQATADHGRLMLSQAQAVVASEPTGSVFVTPADADRIERASAGMVDAGVRAVRVADLLLSRVDQMERWMATGR